MTIKNKKVSASSDWFYHPFAGVKYEELFPDMMAEKEMEIQEEQFITARSESQEDAAEIKQTSGMETDYLIFSECQHVFSTTLDEEKNSVEVNASGGQTCTHKSDILIPSLKVRKSKSSVVRSLIKHGKLSADRLIRVTQVTKLGESENISTLESSIRNIDDQKTFDLFDNIAMESLDTSTNGYQLAEIIRMRRIVGNQNVKYIKPISKDGDQEKY